MARKSPPPAASAPSRAGLLAVVLAATALVYLPALGNDFVNWDDNDYVYSNASLRSGALGTSLWLEPVQGNYHPLTMLSLAVDRRLSGQDDPPRRDRETDLAPGVFHATNVILHVANTALVFLFVYALLPALPESRAGTGRRAPPVAVAFVTALLFGVATLHVESVAWVSERKDVLYTFFFLLSLLLYLRFLRQPGAGRYAGALLAFLAALLSKGQAVTLAPTLVAVDWLLDRPEPRARLVREKAPFFLLALTFGVVAVFTQARYGNVLGRAAQHPLPLRPFFAAYSLVQYSVKLAVPLGLQAFYPYTLALAHPVALYGLYFPLAAAIVASAFYWRRRAPVLAFGVFFFLVNIVTVLQLLPVGGAVMADRYSYVPSIGVFLMAGWAFVRATVRWPERARAIHTAFAVYVVVIGIATAGRAAVWHDSLTLWSAELVRQPDSAIAYNNIATYKFHTGDLPGALVAAERAVALDPEWSRSYCNRGMMRDLSGQSALARADYDRTLELQANQPLALNNRGLLRQEAGDLPGAIDDFTKAIGFDPGSTKFHANRGKAYVEAGRDAEANADLTYVLDREGDPELYGARALLRIKDGDPRGAVADFSAVVEHVPDSPYPRLNRARARLAAGDCPGAREDVETAARLGAIPPAARAEVDAQCPR